MEPYFKHDPKLIEKLPTKPRNPAQIGQLPFAISIPTSKEALVLEDRNTSEVIKIYTDGSAHNGKVGAAAVLTCLNQQPRTLYYHLGPETKHMVHKAELIGNILALHLINTEKGRRVHITVGTDNQAALKAYNSDMRKPAHYAAQEVIHLANMLQKKLHSKN